MSDPLPACAVVSLPDVEIQAQISCAQHRLIAIAPGFTVDLATAIAEKWLDLGPGKVQVVVDPDPEVCRLGLGDLAALEMLHATASKLGTCLHQLQGLRVGVIITDEGTTVYSPVPRLVEAGGQPGEKLNALVFDAPIGGPLDGDSTVIESLNLYPDPIGSADMKRTSEDLASNPPMKFDLARKVRVFNTRFEFVEFELHGLSLSRKRVRVPSDLLGLAKSQKAQARLHSAYQLIEDGSSVSGERVTKLKQQIYKRYLTVLPGYGTVILREKKAAFERAVLALKRYIACFQKHLEEKLQESIDVNREVLVSALLPGVLESPPNRWERLIGRPPQRQYVEAILRKELKDAFGDTKGLFDEMKVKVLFKGVTYELLNDEKFMEVASKEIPFLQQLHEEFDAAKANEIEIS
jgi:hypothetical protein